MPDPLFIVFFFNISPEDRWYVTDADEYSLREKRSKGECERERERM